MKNESQPTRTRCSTGFPARWRDTCQTRRLPEEGKKAMAWMLSLSSTSPLPENRASVRQHSSNVTAFHILTPPLRSPDAKYGSISDAHSSVIIQPSAPWSSSWSSSSPIASAGLIFLTSAPSGTNQSCAGAANTEVQMGWNDPVTCEIIPSLQRSSHIPGDDVRCAVRKDHACRNIALSIVR
eukprot:m.495470 g.495470  ORF g.495470 m.495470 type:complete len:182 (+) comp57300_c2_seq13:367-912(+)